MQAAISERSENPFHDRKKDFTIYCTEKPKFIQNENQYRFM